ncbi:MAG: hypothetical protein M3198_00835 [Actinomycetota bacterium]|nr:hypothetical protein [Actinomycetota bacterium]
MSTADLEIELARWRGGAQRPESNAQPLSVEEALDFRNRGNVPDELGRTLRLVLRIESDRELGSLDSRRLTFEPDFFRAPDWRRRGSRPVNVVPLRRADVGGSGPRPWWEDPAMAEMEAEWAASGAVEGIRIPGQYRSFVYKTIALLRAADVEVTVTSISDSMARWLQPDQAERLRVVLEEANSGPP